MKHIFSLLLFLFTLRAQSQKIDFCKYFYLDVSTVERNGKITLSYNPDIKFISNDKFSKFLRKHSNRFSYLLWNKLGALDKVADIYPDSIRMDSAFCVLLQKNNLFNAYLNDLIPNSFLKKEKKDSFSIDDMMFVASGFFYCESIREKDTILVKSICAGRNGEAEIKANRDFTLLEAFAFEGIFYSLLKSHEPKFVLNFYEYARQSLDKHKIHFDSFEALLFAIREECFEFMKNNKNLRRNLLHYYRSNQNNLNFTIR